MNKKRLEDIEGEVYGYFPFHSDHHLNIVVGSKNKNAKSYDFFLDPVLIPNSKVPQQFCRDASMVQVANMFWIIGGTFPCSANAGNYMVMLRKSSNSQIWSLNKKKWNNGPVLPSKYDFINSCALALNSSTVLFVGVNSIKGSENHQLDISTIVLESNQNNIAITFNFATNMWTEQENLTFPVYSWLDLYVNDFSCTVYNDKSTKR